ncbi:MAG: chemotaxis protein CheW [Polyangiaceae bacterium]
MNPPSVGQPSAASMAAVFHVGRYICGLFISSIQEINKNLLLTPVHEAPAYVRGIINLRGNIVTVIDLRRKLGLEPTVFEADTRNVIVKLNREMVGLLVDSVDDIIEIDASAILPTPSHLARELGNAFEGVVQLGNELVAILELGHLLNDVSAQ